jgi:magnesium chelatase family protein
LHVEVGRVSFDEIVAREAGEPSNAIRARVERARAVQRERYGKARTKINAAVAARDMRRYCALGVEATSLL